MLDECELRDKNWVELNSQKPDVDAIADYFFKCKTKTKVKAFIPKSGIEVYLSIEYDKYDMILDHITTQMQEACSFCLLYNLSFLTRSTGLSTIWVSHYTSQRNYNHERQ